jgi:hypothetical protein
MAQEPFDIKDVFSKAMSRFNASGGGGGLRMPELNYSPEEFRELVNARKAEALSILIALLAVYGSYMMYDKRTKEITDIELQIKTLEEKEQPAKDYQKIVEENKAYLASLPPALVENKFISELTTWAGQRGIKIKSFEPPRTKTEGFYRSTSIKMNCMADNFYDALLFLSDIERAKFALKIDSFSANSDISSLFQNTGFGRNAERVGINKTKSPIINMDLLIVSTDLIEKDKEKDKDKDAKTK